MPTATSLPALIEALADIASRKIERLFKPGAKVTILVRNPDHGKDHSADLIVSNDSLDEIQASLDYLKTR